MSPRPINVVLDAALAARLEAELAQRILRGERASRAGIVRELLHEHLPPAPPPEDERQERLPGLDAADENGGER